MQTLSITNYSNRIPSIADGLSRQARFRIALIFAVVLHLILVSLLPGIDGLKLFPIGREGGINVFLQITKEEDPFERSLNQQLPLPDSSSALIEPALGSASPQIGDEDFLTQATPQANSQHSDAAKANTPRQTQATSIRVAPRLDRTAIKLFAQQEAVSHAIQNPRKVAYFARSFNSRLNYKRRTRAESYKNQYGDYYLKTRSSVGDICFVQKQDNWQDELSTNTVFFFKCGEQPLKLKLDSDEELVQPQTVSAFGEQMGAIPNSAN